jgi:type VI protein secretion system component VasK
LRLSGEQEEYLKGLTLACGLIALLLGGLWLLQGQDVVHVRPLLCFSDCIPFRSASPRWAILGAALFAAGVAAVWWGLKRQSKSADTKTDTSG